MHQLRALSWMEYDDTKIPHHSTFTGFLTVLIRKARGVRRNVLCKNLRFAATILRLVDF